MSTRLFWAAVLAIISFILAIVWLCDTYRGTIESKPDKHGIIRY